MMTQSWPKLILRLLTCLLAFLLVIVSPLFAASFGAADISLSQVIAALAHSLFGLGEVSPLIERIVMDLRFPRILLAIVAGAGLSLAGSVLQTVTRNPLADPYLFGISSGAAFGAVVVMSLMGTSFMMAGGSFLSWSHLSLSVGAFIGASLSILLVLSLSGFGRGNQVERMLLSGVATSFMFGALTSLVLYFSSPQAAASVLFWSLGSFTKATWSALILPSAVVLLCGLVFVGLKRQLLALLAGDETAHTLGVNVVKLRLGVLLLCSLLTATLVASCGGIGFVGLMVPHLVRLLLPRSQSLGLIALVGGLFMLWVDVFARCILANQELPVGIITAAIGSVFFLVVLRGRR
ncbi:transport system permease protein [Shewanella denitrificans OS217]|uniref:Transport system permease protein n=1 Tax=Shewanella denitrificans (strain OS217 / ATCC BAA-1090 / DSM 15013) TaxID=318161 RepID=Q12Q71_SHEDO|nr:transport system permease protein [Shewanella denitrificans OS217]